jgi:hypothetical protein
MPSYRAPDAIAAEVLDGEAIVIDLVSGAYFSFSGWSSWVWESLASGVDRDALAGSFEPTHGFDEFVNAVVAAGLLVPRGDLAPVPPPPRPDGPMSRLEYDRFDDMADMIQLDPVHDVSRETGWPRPVDG